MTWQEGLVAFALTFEGFQLRGDINGAVAVVTNVERYNAYRVAGDEELIVLLVVEDEGEDAVKVFEERAYP